MHSRHVSLRLPPLPLPHAVCTHSFVHALAASVLLPSQAAAGGTVLRQVTTPRGGGLRVPDACLGAEMVRFPKAS